MENVENLSKSERIELLKEKDEKINGTRTMKVLSGAAETLEVNITHPLDATAQLVESTEEITLRISERLTHGLKIAQSQLYSLRIPGLRTVVGLR